MGTVPIRVRTPNDLIPVVAGVLGFHPTNSLVAVALQSDRQSMLSRFDLPQPNAVPRDRSHLIAHLTTALANNRASGVILLAYGPPDRTDSILGETALACLATGLRVFDTIHVHDGHYQGLDDPHPQPVDPDASQAPAQLALAGIAALPDADAFRAQVAPLTGPAHHRMLQATAAARQRLDEALSGLAPDERRVTLAHLGETAILAALTNPDQPLDDAEAAWVTLLVSQSPAAHLAWRRALDQHPEDINLWIDLTRRAHPDLVADVGTVLVLAAWATGQGVLAGIAVDRIRHDVPNHPVLRRISHLPITPPPPTTPTD